MRKFWNNNVHRITQNLLIWLNKAESQLIQTTLEYGKLVDGLSQAPQHQMKFQLAFHTPGGVEQK